MGKIGQIAGQLTIQCWKTATITSDLSRKYGLDELVWLEQSTSFCPTWDSRQWLHFHALQWWFTQIFHLGGTSFCNLQKKPKRRKNTVSLCSIAVCTQQWWSMPLFLLLLESKPSTFLAALKGLQLHEQNTFLSSQKVCFVQLENLDLALVMDSMPVCCGLWMHHPSTWNQGW